MVNDLLTQVKGIFRKLQLKLFPPENMPEPPQPSVKAKPKASSSSPNPKASRKKPVRIAKGVSKK